MKVLLNKYPMGSRFVLAILLYALALILSIVINKGILKEYIANIIFSLIFMSIHVLDENVMENIGHMILLIITIPVGHLIFVIGLLKSKTLFFPIGLHIGNNWATRHLITNSDSGDSFCTQ